MWNICFANVVGGTPARPNKFRKRKRFASKPFKFATFVSPLPKKFAAQYFSGTPVSLRSNSFMTICATVYGRMRISVKETFTQWYSPAASDIASQWYCASHSDIFAAQMWMAGHPHPFRYALILWGGSPCPPDNFHLLCVKEIHAVFYLLI